MDSAVKKTRCTTNGLLLVACLYLLPTGNACSAEPDVLPLDIQAKLFLAALTYVNNLSSSADDAVEIGFVYFSAAANSRQRAAELMKACEAYQDKTVGGRTFKTVLIEYQGSVNMRDKITRHGIEALFIAAGPTAACAEVTEVTRDMKVLSLTADKQQVEACGISLGVAQEEGKPKVYLNLESARAEGKEFSSKLIRVATVVSSSH